MNRVDEGGSVNGDICAAQILRPGPESRGAASQAHDLSNGSSMTATEPEDDVDNWESDVMSQPGHWADVPKQPPVTFWEFVEAVRNLRSNG